MLVEIPEDRHWWFASRTRAIESLMGKKGGRADSRVLDVGCGAGNMGHHLRQYGRVTGVDSFIKPLLVARDRQFDVVLGTAERLPVPTSSFDLVATLDIVEHCENDLGVLAECSRACRPGGRLLLTVPAFPWLWSRNDEINGHHRRYRARELRDKVEGVGLKIERMTYNNCFAFPIAALLIVLRRRLKDEPKLAAPSTDEDAYQVEMEPVSPLVNTVLGWFGRIEAALVRRFDLPVGTGIICVARKEGS